MYHSQITSQPLFSGDTGVFKNVLHYSSFVEDSYLLIHVETVPIKMSYLDRIRFRRTVAKSIQGQVLRVLEIQNHLIYLHVQVQTKKRARILLLDKIAALKKMIQVDRVTELWIIKDLGFLCIGLVQGVPVFFKTFEVILDVIDNLDTLIQSINEHYPVVSIRTFGIDHINMPRTKYQYYEYTTEFMEHHLNQHKSLNEYCKSLYATSQTTARHNLYYGVITLLLTSGALLLRCVRQSLVHDINQMRREITDLNANREIPTPDHYRVLTEMA